MKHKHTHLFVLFIVTLLFLGATPTDPNPSSKTSTKLTEWIDANPKSEYVKAWIYFKDKGFSMPQEIHAALERRKAELGARTLWRRSKVGAEVNLRDLPVHQEYIDKVLAHCDRERATSRLLNAVSVEVDAVGIEKLAAFDFVDRIDLVAACKSKWLIQEEPDAQASTGISSRGLNYGSSYTQLNQINVPDVHDLGFSGEGVIVCMMDTGYYKDHESFAALDVIAEWDFINDDGNTQNEGGDDWYQHYHGTATWSALGGLKDGTLYGPAYGASFLLAKTEDVTQEVPLEEDWWTEGIEWAEANGADVVSSSLLYDDWYTYSDMDGQTAVTTIAANWATDMGVVVVNAMGNNGNYVGSIGAPADSPGAISVGSVNSYGEVSSFSSIGPTYDGRIKPDLCAMGENTFCASADYGNSYYYTNGTSLSTPLIGGIVALLLEAHPDWTPDDVKEALHQTGSYANNPDNYYGWGIADAFDALHMTGFSLLDTSVFTLSEDTGGTATFTLNAGSANAGRKYILLGSLSGTQPGHPLPGGVETLPLNWDVFTDLVISLLNTAVFADFLGTLDGNGNAVATMDTFGRLPPGSAGQTVHFAYCCNNPFDFVSNPVEIRIVP